MTPRKKSNNGNNVNNNNNGNKVAAIKKSNTDYVDNSIGLFGLNFPEN